MDMEQNNSQHVEGVFAARAPEDVGDGGDALVEMARLRRTSRDRTEQARRPAEAIGELPEDQRPFSRYLAGRDARPASMRAYLRKARRAQCLLIEAGVDARFTDVPLETFPWHFVTPAVAAAYTQILRNRYSNAKSRENLVGVVRRLVGHCAAVGLMSITDRERVLDQLPVPGSAPKGSGRELSLFEIRRLLSAKSSPDDRLNLRDTALIAFFLATGLRVSEVVELEVSDLTMSDEGCDVAVRRTKSGASRHVWLSSSSAAVVREWLSVRGDHPGALFESSSGPGRALTPLGASELLARRAKAAGLTEHFSSHDFRRTFATRALRDGVDPFTVQRLLGHVNVQTTLIYDRRTEMEDRVVVEHLDVTYLLRHDREDGQ